MTNYRWNVPDFAQGYDDAAQHIHPHYAEMQQQIVALLAPVLGEGGLVVDAGGGSGRLMEKVLAAYPTATALVVDQSEPFLGLAERRLQRFAGRASMHRARLQEDWFAVLPQAPMAIVSMSAIHHLDAAEKQTLYQKCAAALTPGGVLLNGDEVLSEDEDAYKRHLADWAVHMQKIMDNGAVPPSMHKILHAWRERNIDLYDQPKQSGDDCHQTAEQQLSYFKDAGLTAVESVWQREMWAIMKGGKP